MSDEEEMEDFDINDEDLRRAYNPGGKRTKMSKEEAMLGIWASKGDSGSESDENGDQFSYKNQAKKFSRGKKSNIDFVESKSYSGKKNDQNENSDDKVSDEDEFDNFVKTKRSGQVKEEIIEESDSDNDNMNELSTGDNYLLNQFGKQPTKSETNEKTLPSKPQENRFKSKPKENVTK